MATKSAGRVSIRVLPDSTGFKRDLEKALKRIENQVRAKIEVELDLTREQIAKIKRQIESIVIKLKPTVELNLAESDLEAIKARIEAMKPKVNIDLDTAVASRRIASLTRTRTMTIIPILAKFEGLAAHLKGISGLNVLGDMITEGIHFVQNMDRIAVSLGVAYTKMAALVALIGSAAGSALVLGNNIASIGNLAIFGPGFMTALGIQVGVVVAAMKDMKTVLKDLGPGFKNLQDIISKSFWEQAATPIREMVNGLMPTLNDKLKVTAERMGAIFGELANAIKSEAPPERVAKMFDRMNSALDIARGAIKPFVSAFVTLGDHGSKYFERFSTWIVKLSTQFDNFITEAANDGRLDKWTEDAITQTKALGNTLRGVVRIFAGLGDAAARAGSLNLTDLGNNLNKFADIVNSPRFQNTLTTIFSGANEAMQGILRGVAKLGPAVESAAPSIRRIFESVGAIAEKVGGMLAGVISNPVVQRGFEDFFHSIDKALANLAPAVRPFANSLGSLMTELGKVLEGVSRIVNAFVIYLGPTLDDMGNKFSTLIEPFSNTIEKMIWNLTPLLDTINTNLVGPLVEGIKKLLPYIDDLIPKVVEAGSSIAKNLGEIIKPIVNDILPALIRLVGDVLPLLSGLIDLFTPTAVALLKQTGEALKTVADGIDAVKIAIKTGDSTTLADWWNNLFTKGAAQIRKDMDAKPGSWGDIIAEILTRNVQDGIAKAAEKSWKEFFKPIVDKFVQDWNDVWSGKADADFTEILVKLFPSQEQAIRDVQKWLDDFFNGVADIWNKTWDKIGKLLRGENPGGGPQAPGAPGGGGKGSMGVGAKLMPSIFDQEAEKTWLQTMLDNIGTQLGTVGTIVSTAIGGLQAGSGVQWNTFWDGFKTAPGTSLPQVAVDTGVNLGIMGSNIGTFIAQNAPSWGGFFSTAASAAGTAMGLSNDSVVTNVGSMGANIGSFIAQNAPSWSSFFTNMGSKVGGTMQQMSGVTQGNLAGMAMSAALGFGQMVASTAGGMGGIGQQISSGWGRFQQNFQGGVQGAVNIAGTLGPMVQNTVSGFSIWSNGASLVRSFANGMNANLGLVGSAAWAIANEVAKYMPHSPAPFGPLSGKGYTDHSGQSLVEDLASGMMSNMHKVRSATAAVAEAARIGATMDLTTDLGKDGVVIDRREVNLRIYNPVSEPTSKTIEKSANTLRMAKAL